MPFRSNKGDVRDIDFRLDETGCRHRYHDDIIEFYYHPERRRQWHDQPEQCTNRDCRRQPLLHRNP